MVEVVASDAAPTRVIDDQNKSGAPWLRTLCTSAGVLVAMKAHCAGIIAVNGGQTDGKGKNGANVACI